jgi:hypothetical protein
MHLLKVERGATAVLMFEDNVSGPGRGRGETKAGTTDEHFQRKAENLAKKALRSIPR